MSSVFVAEWCEAACGGAASVGVSNIVMLDVLLQCW